MQQGDVLSGPLGDPVYPIVDGIPVLLSAEADRSRITTTTSSPTGNDERSPLDFYNQTRDHDKMCREELPDVRKEIAEAYDKLGAAGPSLEIGSGKGSLAGIGAPYVALDYSLSALRSYVDGRWQRVCASAESLPFFDASFSFVYSVATLEHVVRPDRAFGEIDRILKPGGVAFLLPAWHCVQYNCDGIPVRPHSELPVRHKLVKLSLPIRESIITKAAMTLPRRLLRRVAYFFRPSPTQLRFVSLAPDYSHFWMSDSDAAVRLDCHEGALFFYSRAYTVISPGGRVSDQLLARHVPLIVRKPVDLGQEKPPVVQRIV